MKLNLGCGSDYKQGYLNVDFRDPCDLKVDLSQFPWPWEDKSIDEILMLDFLEHFPYRQTDVILHEVWRVLKTDGTVEIQVPDFEHCAHAALEENQFLCNVCGNSGKDVKVFDGERCCGQCKTPMYKVSQAALNRLYGGQDFEGNWHFTAFTKELLQRKLSDAGFYEFKFLEKHHQWKNWNFKIRAKKKDDLW